MRKLYEIYLTEDFVDSKSWLNFLLKIGKLNGLFRHFKIKVKFENQIVKYFLEVSKEIPSILSELPEFILKEIPLEDFKARLLKPFSIMTKRENNIIDLYDKFESKKIKTVKEAIICIRMINFKNYFSKSTIEFEDKKGKIRI